MMDCLNCSQTTFWLDVIIWTENTNSADQPRCAETCLLSDEYHTREIFLFSDANQTIIYVRQKCRENYEIVTHFQKFEFQATMEKALIWDL